MLLFSIQQRASADVDQRMGQLHSSYFSLPGVAVSGGVFSEVLIGKTAESYSNPGLGFSAAFEEKMTKYWNGGLKLRWTEWTRNSLSSTGLKKQDRIGALTGLSEVILKFNFSDVLGDTFSSLKGVASFGLGFVLLTPGRVLTAAKATTARGETVGDIGLAVRYIVSPICSVNVSAHVWRGFNTSHLSAFLYALEVSVGDVNFL